MISVLGWAMSEGIDTKFAAIVLDKIYCSIGNQPFRTHEVQSEGYNKVIKKV